jgi:hypothetical protein
MIPSVNSALSTGGANSMNGRQLYRRFRGRIETLADSTKPSDVWLAELQVILGEFKGEIAAAEPLTARSLSDELCDQLEYEADRTLHSHRRDVLNCAVKNLE